MSYYLSDPYLTAIDHSIYQYDNVEGRTILLPSDDQDISIQMRGGPEPLMVTGWAQILALDPTYR